VGETEIPSAGFLSDARSPSFPGEISLLSFTARSFLSVKIPEDRDLLILAGRLTATGGG
jgi:hypothetical protein